MFRRGKVLKVKVELSPEVVGFGRATVVDSQGSRLFLQLRTSKGEKRNLPKGTRVWFVSDSLDNPFNGLWSTTILNSRLIEGKAALECTRPKFEAHLQRRKASRVAINFPVHIRGEKYEELKVATRNVSRTGIGLEAIEDCAQLFPSGHHLDVTMDTPTGPMRLTVRVVSCRFNWLANKTDIGFEFVDPDEATMELVNKLVVSVAGEPMSAPSGKESSPTGQVGQLSSWLKSTKDNVSFVKPREAPPLSDEDLEELQTDGEDDTDSEHVSG